MSSSKPARKSSLLIVGVLGFAVSAGIGLLVFQNQQAPSAASPKTEGDKTSANGKAAVDDKVEEAPSPPRGSCSKVMNRAALDQSLALGTAFLLQHQKPEGNFDYEYNWVDKSYTAGDNQVRQAGALWGLALIYHDRPSPEVNATIERAFAFFRTHSRVTTDGRRYVVYPGDKDGGLGTVALVALAYVDFLRAANDGLAPAQRETLVRERDEYLAFIAGAKRSDGLFFGRYTFADGKPEGKASPYSDGEALLALIKAAKYAGHAKYEPLIREAADAGYRLNVEEARKANNDSDITKGYYQWSSMAFFELATSGWQNVDKYGDWLISLADWMIDVHRTLTRERNTGYAYEGIIPAYELARQRNLEKKALKFGCVIEKGLEKLTSWQVGHPLALPKIAERKPDDVKALGGIQNQAVEPQLRIDVTQHQMHAVILARRYYWPN